MSSIQQDGGMRLLELPPLPVELPAPNPRHCSVLGVTLAWAPPWETMSPAAQAVAWELIHYGWSVRSQDVPSAQQGAYQSGYARGRRDEAAEQAELQRVAVAISRNMPAGTLADRYRAAGERDRADQLDQVARARGFRV